jgi:phosphohistidine phosphatase
MRIYLMRHGEAVQAGPDTTRALSAKGRSDTAKVAKFLQAAKTPVSAIWHSSKTRAFETANLLGKALGTQIPTEAHEGLDPNDSAEDFATDLEHKAPDQLLVVGHLPFVEKLASHLVCRDRSIPVAFKTGTLAALEGGFEHGFIIIWAVTPECLP